MVAIMLQPPAFICVGVIDSLLRAFASPAGSSGGLRMMAANCHLSVNAGVDFLGVHVCGD
jgi:hypothetical protein